MNLELITLNIFHETIYLKGLHWNCQNARIRQAKVFDFSPPDKLVRGTYSLSLLGLTLISKAPSEKSMCPDNPVSPDCWWNMRRISLKNNLVKNLV